MKRLIAISAAVLSPLLLASGASASMTYNPQTQFSSSNTSGALWSYGVLSGATLNLFSSYQADNGTTGLDTWSNNPTSSPYPGIYDNTNSTSALEFGSNPTIEIPGQTLVLHPPNSSTDQTDLRFTAPSNLTITNISATFAAADTQGTSSDVHVYVNGVDVWDSTVTGTAGNGSTSLPGANSGPYTLTTGQTIEFRVGDGSNTYSNDGTSLVASITATPEPASVSLAAIGTVALLARRRRQA